MIDIAKVFRYTAGEYVEIMRLLHYNKLTDK